MFMEPKRQFQGSLDPQRHMSILILSISMLFLVTLGWFELSLGPFEVEFACSPRGHVGFLQVLHFPPTVQRHALETVNCP